jgi:hypothetical protein
MMPCTTPVLFGGASPGNDAFTKLLLHADRANAATKLLDYSPAAHGLATMVSAMQISTAQFKFGGSSLFGNGSSYCTFPNSSDWEFGAGDFTVDWWEYRTNNGAVLSREAVTTYAPFLIGWGVGGQSYVYMTSNGSAWDIAYSRVMNNIWGAWAHFAVVRKGSTFWIFRNGIQQDTWVSSLALAANSNPLCIGAGQNGNGYNGYIDELRVSKGIARWTTNFTPPTAPYAPDPPAIQTVLLAHMDGANGSTTFTDVSPWQRTITPVGGTQISTAQSKFGGASAAFNGTGYLSCLDSPDFDFGSGDFSIDWWARVNALGVQYSMFGKAGSAITNGYYFYVNVSGTMQFAWLPSDGPIISIQTAVLVTDTNWHHYVAQRRGTVMEIYFDGTLATNGAITASASIVANTNNFAIGQLGDFNPINLNGNIDEFRVSKGIARWMGNFTPPTAPYS